MKRRTICAAAVSAAAVLLGSGRPLAQSKAKAQNVPEIPYESVANFFKMPPNIYFGEGIGVATNSKGHVFVYTRSGETRLFEFDEKGAFVRELGQGLYGFVFAHAVRVDKDDNIWAVDEGSNMVIKFNPLGRVVMLLGRRPMTIVTRPCGLNLTTMFDPSSTAQMLSSLSTRTACAKTSPYSPCPSSRTKAPFWSNSKSRVSPLRV